MQRLTIKRQTKAKQPHFHITTFYGYLCLYQSISKNHTKNPGGKTSIFIHELNYKKPTIFNGKTQRKSAVPLGQDHPWGRGGGGRSHSRAFFPFPHCHKDQYISYKSSIISSLQRQSMFKNIFSTCVRFSQFW